MCVIERAGCHLHIPAVSSKESGPKGLQRVTARHQTVYHAPFCCIRIIFNRQLLQYISSRNLNTMQLHDQVLK